MCTSGHELERVAEKSLVNIIDMYLFFLIQRPSWLLAKEITSHLPFP